jgi:hypothetical protein
MWYAAGVDWSVRQQEGFALAAAARGDRAARAALPGLSSTVAQSAAAVAARLANDDAGARRAWVRRMLAAEQPAPARDQTARPARALALLAADVDKTLGRAWLAAAPLPRPGYAADPGLCSLLRKLAARARTEVS